MPTIACLSDSIQIFEEEHGKYVQSASYNFQGDPGKLRGENICWTKNGKWLLGTASDSGFLPLLKYSNHSLVAARFLKASYISAACCFNWTNHQVALGSETGVISLWETKGNKPPISLSRKITKPVKFMSISDDDTHLAASDCADIIRIFGLTTSKQTATLSLDSGEEFSDLCFSTCKKQYLGCSTIEGSVVVWDTYKSIPIMHDKGAHLGATTGLAMSKINFNVVASVSLTKTLVLHDIRKKSPIFNLNSGKSLTTVDLFDDNACLGTIDGQIIVLDLRNNDVLHSIKANASRIRRVRVAPTAGTGKCNDTALSTPNTVEILEEKTEVSISEILSPLTHESSTPPSNLHGFANSASRLIVRSTPNPELPQTPNATSIANNTDSFLRAIATPVSQPSPILPVLDDQPGYLEGWLKSSNSLNGKSMAVKKEESEQLTEKQNNVLDEILTALKELKTEVEGVKSDVRKIQKDQEELAKKVVENHQAVRMAIYGLWDDVEILPGIVRLEHMYTRQYNTGE